MEYRSICENCTTRGHYHFVWLSLPLIPCSECRKSFAWKFKHAPQFPSAESAEKGLEFADFSDNDMKLDEKTNLVAAWIRCSRQRSLNATANSEMTFAQNDVFRTALYLIDKYTCVTSVVHNIMDVYIDCFCRGSSNSSNSSLFNSGKMQTRPTRWLMIQLSAKQSSIIM